MKSPKNTEPEIITAEAWSVELGKLEETGEPVVMVTLILPDGKQAVGTVGEAGAASMIMALQEIRWQVCTLEAIAAEEGEAEDVAA